MKIKTRSRIIVFILSFLIWVAMTSILDLQEVIAGVILAFIVALIAGEFLITSEKKKHIFHRYFSAMLYLFRFMWEMIKANFHVAYIVINPMLPIKPGIVKIRTKLTKDSALTVLANSITLTPGTLTVDIDPEDKALYIHWIDVASKDIETNTKLIGGRFEKLLTEVFE